MAIPCFTPTVSSEVFEVRPDYTALSLLIDVEAPLLEPSDGRGLSIPDAPEELPALRAHLEAWDSAYRAFGTNPRRYPCSASALKLRVEVHGGLQRIHPVVDAYNAISVRFGVPIGGEDATAYRGAPRLVRALGGECFDTVHAGKSVTECVPAGEVIWRDDIGVTCRRWNWRQCVRTRVTAATRRAWFVLERLEPLPIATLVEAGRLLLAAVAGDGTAGSSEAVLIDRAGTKSVDFGQAALAVTDDTARNEIVAAHQPEGTHGRWEATPAGKAST
jgi:DNA/RNA-binding domain of Phe-tRNA-synthetase-like protein